MKRLLSIDEVKHAILHMDRQSFPVEMDAAKKSFRDLFMVGRPESVEYLQDEYNSFIGQEKEEELIRLDKDSSHALESTSLLSHMKSLYESAEKESGKWFPFVDFIAALNRQIQNLDIVLLETDSGYCVVRRANYCVLRK